MPFLNIDRDAAHQAAQHELGKSIYPKHSAAEQFNDWVNELLLKLLQKSASISGEWFTITVLLVLLAIGITIAFRIAHNTMRTNRGDNGPLFDVTQLTTAQHRATAESYAAQGDWTAAIRHRLRAVARQLEETGTLQPSAGRTANELATDTGLALPQLNSELRQAATAFNDVTYGKRPGTPDTYQMITALDDQLRSRASAFVSANEQPAEFSSWAPIR